MSRNLERMRSLCYTPRDDVDTSNYKGSNHKVTHHKQSILEAIETAPDVETIGQIVLLIRRQRRAGKLDPEAKTLRKWEDSQWARALQLLQESKTANELCYRFNFFFRWPKSPAVAHMLEATFKLRALFLPSPTQALKAQGVSIAGITD